MNRERMNFDKDWMFYAGDIPVQYAIKAGCTGGVTVCDKRKDGEWTEIAYNDKEVEIKLDKSLISYVTLPHDWIVEGNFSKQEWDAQGYLPTGVGCYRKEFDLPEEYKDKSVSVEFDGVSRNCTVWVNGHVIGNHFSGYSSFSYDISEYLKYGDEGTNCIFVKVDAREFEGWWYEGAGIYRHVYLTVTDKLHVKKWGTFVTTPKISDEEATVKIETTIANDCAEGVCAICETTIYDAEGNEKAQLSDEFSADMVDETVVSQSLVVKNPKKWDLDAPYLYTAETIILVDGTICDTYTTTFGIREAKFTKEGFFLNGKHVDIKGTCNHQDFAGVGVALPDSINEFKIRKLKEMGSNAYRCSHHPPTPELLEACDRIGMLVMDENRKLDCTPRGIEDLKSLILRDRNHPSVVIWCLDNEEVILGSINAKRIETKLRDIVHKMDPTRPTTVAMNHGWNENNYEECVDIVGYNYGQRQDQYIKDLEKYPDRMTICTESTSSTTTRGIYKEDEERGYCSSYETHLAVWCCTHEKSWIDYKNNPRLTGIFVWTGFDYRGEPTPYAWPCINSHFGIMDTCGLPKDAYYYYKSIWTDEPMVHFLPHWDLKEEGESVTVRVFSNCDSIELVLNGKSLGEKEMVQYAHVDFDVKFEKGEIKAIGKKNGEKVCEMVRKTSKPAYKVVLEPDRKTIKSDGCDAVVIYAKIYDEDGNVVPYADNEVNFSVSGGAKIIGVGNGDPSSHEPDKSSKRRAFSGACMAVIQSNGESEKVVFTAKSNALLSDSVTLEIED
jgi:beta-galactosidase